MTLKKYTEDIFMKGLCLFQKEIELIRNAPPEEPAIAEVNKIEVLQLLLEGWVKMYN